MLRAAQVVLEEGIATPDPDRPARRDRGAAASATGCRSGPGRTSRSINPEDDPRYRDYVARLVEVAGRRGITPDAARTLVRTDTTVIAALAVHARRRRRDDLRARGPLPATLRHDPRHHRPRAGREGASPALTLMITAKGVYFLADTHVRPDPTAEEIAEMAVLCGRRMCGASASSPRSRWCPMPISASHDTPSARKMRAGARPHPRARAPARGRRRDAGRHGARPRWCASASCRIAR